MSSKVEYITSPLNYTGGKSKLLPQIIPLFPSKIETFYDIFCGGCNVGINVNAQKHVYNDIDTNLINMFSNLSQYNPEEIIKRIKGIIKEYNLSDTSTNGYDYYNCSSSDGLAKVNKDAYIKLRTDFNQLSPEDDDYYFKFYTLIIYAFNNQIRFNSKGEYNLPIGKRDFNLKMQTKLVKFFSELNKQNAIFTNIDFKDINIDNISMHDFVYLDPPYLASTAAYNENGGWTNEKEKELLQFLEKLNNRNIRYALSNALSNNGRENNILKEWLEENSDIKTYHLNKSYINANYQRQKINYTDEVLITNY